MDMREPERRQPASVIVAAVALLALWAQCCAMDSSSDRARMHSEHAREDAVPVPFAYCKRYLEKLSGQDQRRLRESYQQYHGAYARFMRASRNHEAFTKGDATWLKEDWLRQGYNLTYLVGQNLEDLARTLSDAETTKNSMESRIKAQLTQLEQQGSLPQFTQLDDLSPCIMRKIYPSQFPDQPELSLLLHVRGDTPEGDWLPGAANSSAPPTGKGAEAVEAFIQRARACLSVAPAELVVMLSGPSARLQAAAWAWQSWTSEGFVVPILDNIDREAHALNRLASVARGSVLVALRADRAAVDDLLAGGADCAWLQRIYSLYRRIPALGAMAHGRFAFSHPAAPASLRLLGPGAPDAGGPQRDNQFFKEGATSIPFQYVLYGDMMPMSFRRAALEEVGGFDEDLPQGDEPCSSLLRRDLCARLWKTGWRVGAHDIGLRQAPLEAPSRCPADAAALAERLLEARHGPLPAAAGVAAPLDILMQRVKELNLQKLQPLAPDALSSCPMQQGCSL